jgi:hypothetical protein
MLAPSSSLLSITAEGLKIVKVAQSRAPSLICSLAGELTNGGENSRHHFVNSRAASLQSIPCYKSHTTGRRKKFETKTIREKGVNGHNGAKIKRKKAARSGNFVASASLHSSCVYFESYLSTAV